MKKLLLQQEGRVKSPLSRPAFLRLWLGLMLSRMGDQLTAVALIWFVLQLTNSGVAVGLVVLCFQLPAMLSGPLIGVLLDRYQPRIVMAVDNFGRAVIIATIPCLYLINALPLWLVYALALCAGVLSPATEVGLRLTIPRIVSDVELERANSLSAISWDFATLIGPAIVGFLIIFLRAPIVLLIDALTFLLMGAMILMLPSTQSVKRHSAPVNIYSRSMLGFGILFRMKPVILLTTLKLLFLLMQALVEIVIPMYSQKILNAGPAGYGLLMTAFSIGSLLALAFISRFWMRSRSPGVTLAYLLLLSGLTLAPLIFIRTLPLALLVLCLVGLTSAPYYVLEQSIIQRLVPDQVRGQIFGARSALNAAGYPLGSMLGGVLSGLLGVPFALSTAVLLCLAMGITCLASPLIRGLYQSQAGNVDASSQNNS